MKKSSFIKLSIYVLFIFTILYCSPALVLAGADSEIGARSDLGARDMQFYAENGPCVAKMAVPDYPETARILEREGAVLLRVTIDETGRPVDVKILKRAGYGFDEAALLCANKSKYTPATRNGKPVVCRTNLPIRFKLK